ncbi:MAG: prenyltransferase [Anaerolineae bacterium]
MNDGRRPAVSRLRALIRLARPHFLVGGVVLHGLGVALARGEGRPLDAQSLLWGQLVVTLGQLLTHFSNDYFDLVADQLHPYRPQWSGGSGVLPAGLLPARWALVAACCAGVAALLSAAWLALVIRPGALTALLLGMAIGVAWSYSSPPLRLHATGFGEVAGAGLLAILTPLIGYHLQGGTRYASTVLALLPMAALQLAMLINVSLPDMQSDGAAGKRTMAVRIGPRRATTAAALSYLAAYLLLPPLAATGLPWGHSLAYLAWSPLAAWQIRELLHGAGQDPRRWDRLAFWSIGLVVGSAVTVGAVVVW